MPRLYMSRLICTSETPWNALQSRKLSSARSLQADCRAAPRPAWSRSTHGTTEVCAFNGQLATPLTLRMQPPFRPATRPATSPQSATLRETARGASGDTETCADRVSSETFGSQGAIPVRRPPVGPTPRICRGLATPGPGSGPVSREARPPRRAGPSTGRRAPLQERSITGSKLFGHLHAPAFGKVQAHACEVNAMRPTAGREPVTDSCHTHPSKSIWAG